MNPPYICSVVKRNYVILEMMKTKRVRLVQMLLLFVLAFAMIPSVFADEMRDSSFVHPSLCQKRADVLINKYQVDDVVLELTNDKGESLYCVRLIDRNFNKVFDFKALSCGLYYITLSGKDYTVKREIKVEQDRIVVWKNGAESFERYFDSDMHNSLTNRVSEPFSLEIDYFFGGLVQQNRQTNVLVLKRP